MLRIGLNLFFLFSILLSIQSKITFDPQDDSSYYITIGGKAETILTQLGKNIVNSGVHSFTHANEHYTIGPVWTVFALYNASTYEMPKWQLVSHCGYWEQTCGDHCDLNTTCNVSNKAGGILNVLTMRHENWCHQVVPATVVIHRKYRLVPERHLALTNYSGYLDLSKDKKTSPGWTISNSSGHLAFSKNAELQSLKLRTHPSLRNFSVSEKHGFQSDARFAHYSKAPNFTVQYNNTNCWTHQLSHTLIHEHYNESKVQETEKTHSDSSSPQVSTAAAGDQITEKHKTFIVYTILKKGPEPIKDLGGHLILTNRGLHTFSTVSKHPFVFFDPCNMQFLSLKHETDKTYSVLPISGQSQKPYFCLAVSLNANKPDNLALYEFRDGSNSFQPSNKFIGSISPNYVTEYNLQITEVSTPKNPLPSDTEFSATFEDKTDQNFLINFKYSKAEKCEIILGSEADSQVYSVPFTKADQTISQLHYSTELPYGTQGSYQCGDDFGTFPIPLKYSKIPGTELTLAEHTIHTQESRQVFVSITPPHKERGIWRKSMKYVEDDLKAHHTLVALFIIICIYLFLVVLFMIFFKGGKSKKVYRKKIKPSRREYV